jgi:hypothetical protein
MIDARPMTSTDRIEAALNALVDDGKKSKAAKAGETPEPAEEPEAEANPVKAEAKEVAE